MPLRERNATRPCNYKVTSSAGHFSRGGGTEGRALADCGLTKEVVRELVVQRYGLLEDVRVERGELRTAGRKDGSPVRQQDQTVKGGEHSRTWLVDDAHGGDVVPHTPAAALRSGSIRLGQFTPPEV